MSTIVTEVKSCVSASDRLEAFAKVVSGAMKGRKLEGARTAAACLPGAEAKSLRALFKTGKLRSEGNIELVGFLGTLKFSAHPGSAHVPP